MSNLTTKSNPEDKSSVLLDIKKIILKMQLLYNKSSFYLGELSINLPIKYSNGKSVYGKIAEIYCDEHGTLKADIVLSGTNREGEIFFGCDIEQLNFFDLSCIFNTLSLSSFDFAS